MEEGSLQLKCSVCLQSEDSEARERLFSTTDGLWCHISMSHTIWLPYECVLCPMTCMPSELVLNQHYELLHPAKQRKAIYTYDGKKKMEIRQIFAESLKNSSTMRTIISTSKRQRTNSPKKNTKQQSADKRPQSPSETVKKKSKTGSEEVANKAEKVAPKKPASPLPKYVSFIDNSQSESTMQDDNGENSTEEEDTEISAEISSAEPTESTEKWNKPIIISEKKKSNKTSMQCNLCSKTVSAPNHHVWVWHMPKTRLCCTICEYKTCNYFHIRLHAKRQHKIVDDMANACWTDHTAELQATYNERYRDAFGKDTTVDQPQELMQKEDEIKKKSACRLCGVAIPMFSSEDNHIWDKHMVGRRFECQHCDLTSPFISQIRRHLRRRHAELPFAWTDNTEKLSVEFEKKSAAAFDTKVLASAAAECQICGVITKNKGNHIWAHHIKQKRFMCGICGLGSAFVNESKRHILIHHGHLYEVELKDNIKELAQEFDEKYKAAYGNYSGKWSHMLVKWKWNEMGEAKEGTDDESH